MEKIEVIQDPEKGTWGFYCNHPKLCGQNGVKFSSTEWPTDVLAFKRGQQHMNEHETETPMQDLHEFRNENAVNDDGTLKAGGN